MSFFSRGSVVKQNRSPTPADYGPSGGRLVVCLGSSDSSNCVLISAAMTCILTWITIRRLKGEFARLVNFRVYLALAIAVGIASLTATVVCGIALAITSLAGRSTFEVGGHLILLTVAVASSTIRNGRHRRNLRSLRGAGRY